MSEDLNKYAPDAFDLATAMAEYLDRIGQAYNFAYLLEKATVIVDDLDSGVATDPNYGEY